MANNNDLNSGLTAESIKNFNRAVDKLERTAAEQKQIVEEVLALEEKIGKVRLSYIKDFKDSYSEALQFVAK